MSTKLPSIGMTTMRTMAAGGPALEELARDDGQQRLLERME